MRGVRHFFVVFLSLVAFAAIAGAAFYTIRSPLFLIQIVEVVEQPERAPVEAQAIAALAAVPTGKVSLFELDLAEVESRILANPWIEEVYLQKRFPQTLSIGVKYREPVAIMQTQKQGLRYIDSRGRVFGSVTLMYQPDLPIMSRFEGHEDRLPEAIRLIGEWQGSVLGKQSELASVIWDEERGYRALTSYVLGKGRRQVMVDLGSEVDSGLRANLDRLDRVFQYLSRRDIAVHQVWADAGKKIVVKTARGS